MERLGPKLAAELAPGTLVLSSTFGIPDSEAARIERATGLYATPVYLYRAPGRAG